MTTDVAASLGLQEGSDYIKGDVFPDNPNLFTAKLKGDPVATTVRALDNAAKTGKGAFIKQDGGQRWTYANMTDQQWLSLPANKKQRVINDMYKQHEGGSGELVKGDYQAAFSNLADKVDKIRQNPAKPSDTEILNQLKVKYPDYAPKIDKVRSKGINDSDILNQISVKYSGRMPKVQSNPLKSQDVLPQKPKMDTTPGSITKHDGTYTYINKDGTIHHGKLGDNYVDNTQAIEKKPGLLDKLKDTGKKFISDVKGTISQTKELGMDHPIAAATSALVGGTLDILGGAGRVVGDVVGSAIEKIQNDLDNDPLIKKMKIQDKDIVIEGIKTLATNGMEAYNNWKTKNPEYGQITDNLANTLNLIGIEELGKVGVEKAILKTAEEGAIEVGGEETGKIISRIAQQDIPKAKPMAETLTTMDTSGVKTYKDLSAKIAGENTKVLGGVDKILESNKEIYKPDKLVKNGFNYVDESLKNLGEFYKGAKDIPNLNRIMELYKKSQQQGLTAQEINNIAREYGTEFGQKAFSKISGEPLTSVNAQAFENVRKGVKDTVRDLFKDNKSLQTLDMRSSKLISTKKMVDQVAEKVAKLEAKLKSENALVKLGRQLGRAGAKVVDIASLGSIRGFVSKFFPSNMGYKTMNYLDIEGELSKNLKMLDKLNNSKGNAFVNNLEDLVKSGINAENKKGTLFLPEPKAGAIKSEVKTPINLPAKSGTTIENQEIKNIQNQRKGILPQAKDKIIQP